MFGLGPTELIIIAVIVLLIFGAKRLPEIGKGIGGAIREFREVKKEIRSKGTADEGEERPEEIEENKEIFENLVNMELGHKARLENVFVEIGYPEAF